MVHIIKLNISRLTNYRFTCGMIMMTKETDSFSSLFSVFIHVCELRQSRAWKFDKSQKTLLLRVKRSFIMLQRSEKTLNLKTSTYNQCKQSF